MIRVSDTQPGVDILVRMNLSTFQGCAFRSLILPLTSLGNRLLGLGGTLPGLWLGAEWLERGQGHQSVGTIWAGAWL